MRKMYYEIKMMADEGYVISVPKGRSGQIRTELVEGGFWNHNDEYVEADIGDFVEPITFDEDTNPELKEHYRKIFQDGAWQGWSITKISIQPGYIAIDVDCDGVVRGECFHMRTIKPSSHLKFAIKAPAYDGHVETYTVEIETHQCTGRDGNLTFSRSLIVDEPCESGERKIVFENGIPIEDEDDDWFKVLVYEGR